MIDTQQPYIKLNIRGEITIIVVQAHSDRKRDIRCAITISPAGMPLDALVKMAHAPMILLN
jgi:hypothetical protein